METNLNDCDSRVWATSYAILAAEEISFRRLTPGIQASRNFCGDDENLGTKDIDGIDAEGYRVTQGDLTTTVWIVVETGDLVQVEQKYASAPGMNRIIKNIKFDVNLEDSLFSLTPPAGYKEFRVEMKSDSAIQTEETFVAWLGWWAVQMLMRRSRRWLQGPR